LYLFIFVPLFSLPICNPLSLVYLAFLNQFPPGFSFIRLRPTLPRKAPFLSWRVFLDHRRFVFSSSLQRHRRCCAALMRTRAVLPCPYDSHITVPRCKCTKLDSVELSPLLSSRQLPVSQHFIQHKASLSC
jgi:hypothetical protein